MDAALRDLLTDIVMHAARTGVDAYGQAVYAAPVARQARVEWVSRRFVNAAGQEALSRAVVYMVGDFTLAMADKLTLEDGSTGAIQRLEQWRDEDGQLDHYRLFL